MPIALSNNIFRMLRWMNIGRVAIKQLQQPQSHTDGPRSGVGPQWGGDHGLKLCPDPVHGHRGVVLSERIDCLALRHQR